MGDDRHRVYLMFRWSIYRIYGTEISIINFSMYRHTTSNTVSITLKYDISMYRYIRPNTYMPLAHSTPWQPRHVLFVLVLIERIPLKLTTIDIVPTLMLRWIDIASSALKYVSEEWNTIFSMYRYTISNAVHVAGLFHSLPILIETIPLKSTATDVVSTRIDIAAITLAGNIAPAWCSHHAPKRVLHHRPTFITTWLTWLLGTEP